MKAKILWPIVLISIFVLGATVGTTYRGKFIGGGYAPDFIGHGGGLTNIPNLVPTNSAVLIAQKEARDATNTLNTTLSAALTNINTATLSWPTNQQGTTTIDMSVPWAALSTNNNVAIVGFSGFTISATDTNVQSVTRIFTNNSVGAKTITLPAGCVDLLSIGTIFNTNQGALTVVRYPGMGTNFSWIGK